MTRKNEKSAQNRVSPRTAVADFRIEIDPSGAGLSVLISGAGAIRDFSDSAALIRVKGRYVKIDGEALRITVYESKAVEIVGRVKGVEFINDKT